MARYKIEQKEQTRERIIDAAGRCFKKNGYNGIGVDGLAKEAGVTSGAFYGHFDSKKAAFEASIKSGLGQLENGIKSLQAEYGESWWNEFAKFYLSQKRTCDLSDSCAMQSLTPEVGRADDAMRIIFEKELLKVAQTAQNHQASSAHENRASVWINFSMLIGGVILARAVSDEKVSKEIALAIESAIQT